MAAMAIAAGPRAREILSFIVFAEWRGRVWGVYYPSLKLRSRRCHTDDKPGACNSMKDKWEIS
jgi:hypothetical protein